MKDFCFVNIHKFWTPIVNFDFWSFRIWYHSFIKLHLISSKITCCNERSDILPASQKGEDRRDPSLDRPWRTGPSWRPWHKWKLMTGRTPLTSTQSCETWFFGWFQLLKHAMQGLQALLYTCWWSFYDVPSYNSHSNYDTVLCGLGFIFWFCVHSLWISILNSAPPP